MFHYGNVGGGKTVSQISQMSATERAKLRKANPVQEELDRRTKGLMAKATVEEQAFASNMRFETLCARFPSTTFYKNDKVLEATGWGLWRVDEIGLGMGTELRRTSRAIYKDLYDTIFRSEEFNDVSPEQKEEFWLERSSALMAQQTAGGRVVYTPLMETPHDIKQNPDVPGARFRTRSKGPWVATTTSLYSAAVPPGTDVARLGRSVVYWGSKYVLTNGGLLGFYTRLEAQEKIAARLRLRYPPRARVEEVGISGRNYFERLETQMPLRSGFNIDFNSMTSVVEMSKVAVVKGDSDAGLVWRTVTGAETKVVRRNVALSDVITATRITREAAEVVEEGGRAALAGLLRSGSLNMGKPKFEVIDWAKYDSKVRSIKVANSCMQVHLGVACAAFAKTMQTVRKDGDGGRGNLYAWTPVHGGMARLMELCSVAEDGDRFKLFYYSDNVFAFDTEDRTWISLDVAKMESSSTVEEGQVSMEYIMERMTVTNASDPDISSLRALISVQGAELAHDPVCVRGPYSFKASGLSTGSPNTFLQNHTRMAATIPELHFCFNRLPDSENPLLRGLAAARANPEEDVTLEFPTRAQVAFDLELTAVSDPAYGPLGVAPGATDWKPTYHALDEAYNDPRTSFDGSWGKGLVRTDILGFDTVWYQVPVPGSAAEIFPVAVGVLSWDRLWKLIMFRKTDYQQFEMPEDLAAWAETNDVNTTSVQALLVNLTNLMTLIGAYFVGGFAYEDTAAMIMTLAVDIMYHSSARMKDIIASVSPDLAEDSISKFTEEAMRALVEAFNMSVVTGVADDSDEEEEPAEVFDIEQAATERTEASARNRALLSGCKDLVYGMLKLRAAGTPSQLRELLETHVNARSVILTLHYPPAEARRYGAGLRRRRE